MIKNEPCISVKEPCMFTKDFMCPHNCLFSSLLQMSLTTTWLLPKRHLTRLSDQTAIASSLSLNHFSPISFHIYARAHMRTHTHTRVHTHAHAHTHTHTRARTHAHTHMHIQCAGKTALLGTRPVFYVCNQQFKKIEMENKNADFKSTVSVISKDPNLCLCC